MLHTQEVTGSSPVAPTIRLFRHIRALLALRQFRGQVPISYDVRSATSPARWQRTIHRPTTRSNHKQLETGLSHASQFEPAVHKDRPAWRPEDRAKALAELKSMLLQRDGHTVEAFRYATEFNQF